MISWSPAREGFRTMVRCPVLPLAEIAWRWSFGAAACALLGFGIAEYLNSLSVSAADLLLLRTRHPLLAARALAHILEGSGLRAAVAGILGCTALAVVWMVVAATGRAATLDALCTSVRSRIRGLEADGGIASDSERPTGPWRLRSLVGLHFLRAAVTLAACGGGLAAILLAGFDSQPALTLLVFLAVGVLVWLAWSSLNWLLSLASIFAVRSGTDTFGSLAEAVGLLREQAEPVLAVRAWFGLAHFGLFLCALWVLTFVAAAAPYAPPSWVAAVALFVALLYFGSVDALSIGRLAGYLAILDAPGSGPVIASEPPSVLSGMVDQDERIMGDVDLGPPEPAAD